MPPAKRFHAADSAGGPGLHPYGGGFGGPQLKQHQRASQASSSKASSSSADFAGVAGWETGGTEWTTFTPPRGVDVGGPRWAAEVLNTDPPCLTLRGRKAESVPRVSTGQMHSGFWSSGQLNECNKRTLDRLSEGMLESDITVEGGRTRVRKSRLCSLFSDLISRVRYPPASLEFSWKVVEVEHKAGQRTKATPSDLCGPLPTRPFSLLDNSGDMPAEQPPHFSQHQLRPEQLRSLSWMLACEGAGDSSNGNEPFAVEWRCFWSAGNTEDMDQTIDQVVIGALVRLRADVEGPLLERDTRKPVAAPPRGEGLVQHRESDAVEVSFNDSDTCVVCMAQDLEFVDTGGFAVGCRLRIKPGIKAPTYGWGGVTVDSVGVLVKSEDFRDILVVRFPVHPSWKGKRSEVERVDQGGDPEGRQPVLDLRVRASYATRGGVLADKIGYGKTATTIALIDASVERPLPQIPPVDKGAFIPAKGTLVIVPSNLFEQWLTEISKFVWAGKPFRGSLVAGWTPKTSPLKIFAMSNVTPLTRVKASDLAEADVVLCSYRLLFSPIYQDRRRELGQGVTLGGLVHATRELLARKARVRSGRKGDVFVRNWEELEFPVLEMFYWGRVVFDEFHELESFDSLQQNSLQHLRSFYRWGLTGTPPVDCNAGVIFMASLFRVDLPGYLREVDPRSGYPDLSPWEGDRLLSECAGRFLDQFARQNTAELPQIRLEEHVIVVHHTAAERALYLGQAHDAPDLGSEDAFDSEDHVRALERLLKLCSHFQAAGDAVCSAHEECDRITEQKERRLVRARNQLQRCCRVILLLEQKLAEQTGCPPAPDRKHAEIEAAKARLANSGDGGARAIEALETYMVEARADRWADCLEALSVHMPRNEELAARLGAADSRRGYAEQWEGFYRLNLPPEKLAKMLEGQVQEQAQNLQEVYDATGSLEFFRRTVMALERDDSPEARSCTVCLEEGLPLDKLAITPCAHAFCIDCLQATISKFKSCSICRQQLSAKDVRPLANELGAGGPSKSSSSSSSSSAAPPSTALRPATTPGAENVQHDKYGTKLAALVQKLQELRRDDTTAKVILFVQFDDLKRKVAAALGEFGIPAIQLQGGVSQRSGVIRDWQSNPASATFVLLLSLAQSASGANLTAASHVVFLHPMLAPKQELAVGYELQAIGRARRHGQKREAVHIWRFVTAGTVEQTITERHQSDLWEREQAREQVREQAREQEAREQGDAGDAAAGAAAAGDANVA